MRTEDTPPRRKRSERAPILEPGSWLDTDLRVIDHLGGSRKVDVYLCSSVAMDGVVTCKVLRPEFCIDFSALQSVLEEGETVTRMRHPNVVEGYRFELEVYPRIVMEHLGGQTVAASFLSGNFDAFDIMDVIGVVVDVSDALTYVHQQGFLHLDVKPSNVMYDEGHSTLFDFSVAEEYSSGDRLRDNAGTVEYMAPEQTRREQLGHATDVFGLGVLFYQLLTGGELPYPVVRRQDPDEENKTKRELNYDTPPAHPSTHNPDVPKAIGDVALVAIRPDMADRYATPSDFKKGLLRALEEAGL